MKLQVLVTYGAEGEGGAYNHTVAINQCHDERVLRLQRSVNSRDDCGLRERADTVADTSRIQASRSSMRLRSENLAASVRPESGTAGSGIRSG